MRISKYSIMQHVNGYLFIFPIGIFFVVFMLYPCFEAIRMSFYDYRVSGAVFVGFLNYEQIFHDSTFLKALTNTLKYVLYVVPLTIGFSLFVSYFIYSMTEKWTSFFRVLFYLPTISSSVAISIVFAWIFNPGSGAANAFLRFLGLPSQIWFADPGWAFHLIVFIILFSSVGQPIILYTAAFGGISTEYYDAAKVDGAGKIPQFFKITLPLLMPTTLYCTVIATIHAFMTFVYIDLLTSGGPDHATTSLIYQLYVEAFSYNRYGTAAGMGIVLLLMVGAVGYFQFRTMSSKVEY